jgi:CDP-4-dehydro-6-deoxyglucose reductase
MSLDGAMPDATRRARVIGRKALSVRVTELTLLVEGTESFQWLPGQHVTLRPDLPDADRSFFSIARTPDESSANQVTLAARNASELLGHAPLGALLVLEGPFGALTWRDAPAGLLVGAGTGVAPLRAIVRGVLESDRRANEPRDRTTPLVLLAGNRTVPELLWHDELVALAREHSRFAYEPVVSQPDASYRGRRGYVQDHLGEVLARLPAGARAYICGGTAMVGACRDLLGKLGVPDDRILAEADS